MKIFEMLKEFNYEQLVFCHDEETGLKAIICIHDTTLGPALGGTRIWDYKSEEEALYDVLRLARGMTYKNAAAGLDIGGGKAVIIGNPNEIKSEALLRVFGRYVDSLGGRYITAEDMNAGTKDMAFINAETDYVVGLEGKSGDPSPVTAYGVFMGIQAAALEVYGSRDLKDRTIAVQGLGAVGYKLCKYLYEAGANLIVTARSQETIHRAVADFEARSVSSEEIYGVSCDIFAPCAIGAVINDSTIKELKCKIIAGSANNQLEAERHGNILKNMGILYVPDFVINSGGAMNVYEELKGYNKERAMGRAATIFDSVSKVIDIAKNENISTLMAAERMAEERISKISKVNNIYKKNNNRGY